MRKIILKGFILFLSLPLWVMGQTEEDSKKACEVFNPSVYENPERKPLRNELRKYLGDMEGKIVADIGAGAGYFSFEYAKDASQVIATELDDRLINYMNQKKQEHALENLQVMRAKENFAELKGLNIDVVLMVDVYHELDDPKNMLPALKQNMSANSKIVIVESHISPKIVTDYLSLVGFANNQINTFSYETSCGQQQINIISASYEGAN